MSIYNEAFFWMCKTYGTRSTGSLTKSAKGKLKNAKVREKKIIYNDPESYLQTYKEPNDSKGIAIDLLLKQYQYGSIHIKKELELYDFK